MHELMRFSHRPFREVARPPPGRHRDEDFLRWTDEVLSTAFGLLREALGPQSPGSCSCLFDGRGAEFFAHLMGLFELNNVDVEVDSPVRAFVQRRGQALMSRLGSSADEFATLELQALEALLREKEVVMKCVWGEETTGIFGDDGDPIPPGAGEEMANMEDADMEEEQEERAEQEMVAQELAKVRAEVASMSLTELLAASWPTFHGVALYRTVARMNHSCTPNVRVTFPDNSHRLKAEAILPVPVGAELRISYIKEDAPLAQRGRQLKEYGFVCGCARCLAERQALEQSDSGAGKKRSGRLK